MPVRDGFSLWNNKPFSWFRSNKYLNQFSSSDAQELRKKHEEEKARNYVAKVQDPELFNDAAMQEQNDLHLESTQKFLGAEILGCKLQDQAPPVPLQVAQVRGTVLTGLTALFLQPPAYQDAARVYSEQVVRLRDELVENPHSKSSAEIETLMNTYLAGAENAIKAQQKQEADALQAYLNDPNNQDDLREAYVIPMDQNLDALKTLLTDALKAEHTVQNRAFQKTKNQFTANMQELNRSLPPLGTQDPKNFKLDAFEKVEQRRKEETLKALSLAEINRVTFDNRIQGIEAAAHGDANDPTMLATQRMVDKLDAALYKPTPAYLNAMKIYKSDVETLKNKAAGYHTGALEEAMAKAFTGIAKALEAQQKKDKENLEAQLNDPEFIADACAVYAIAPVTDDAVAALKKKFTDTLAASHKQQLEDLEKDKKAANTQIASLRTVEDNFYEKYYLLTIMDNSPEMRAEIARAKGNNDPVAVRANMQGGFAEVEGVSLAALNFVVSKTGSKMKQDPPGTWTLDFKARMQQPLYYLSPAQKPLADMMNLAALVKASGSETITFKLKFDEPPASERARQALEAAIRMGFDPKNIKIVNTNTGKTFVPRELTEDEKKPNSNVFSMNHQDQQKDKAPVGAPFADAHRQAQYKQLLDLSKTYVSESKKLKENIPLTKGNYEDLKTQELENIQKHQDIALRNVRDEAGAPVVRP